MRSQQGKGLILFLLLAAVIAGAVVFFYRGNLTNSLSNTPVNNITAKQTTNQNNQTQSGDVGLMIDPATVNATTGQTFSVDVKADPKTEAVGAATLKLSFDPDYLEATSIKAGPALPVVLAQGKVSTGSAEITLGANPNNPMKQAGVMATMTFKAKKSGKTQITIDKMSQVAANGKYVQGSSQGSSVIIKQ